MSYVSIIFRPRLIALFSSSFLFIVNLLSLQHIENCNALECFSKQRREEMANGRKFSSPRPQNAKKKWLSLTLGKELT